MNQECIFQPASSSSTAAFVHVSAVLGGIAPGTPLYGAYGQPLPGGQQAPPGPLPPLGPHYQAAQCHLPHHSQSSAYHQTAQRSWGRSPVSSSSSPQGQDYPSHPPMPAPPDRVASTRTPQVSSKDPTPRQPSPATSHPDGPGSNGHSGSHCSSSSTNSTAPMPQVTIPPPPSISGGTSVMSLKSLLGNSAVHDR